MLSVVIPSYNHEKYLASNVPEIRQFLQNMGIGHEIIVVDDGSSDGTAETSARLGCRLIRNNRNMGKGISLKRGFLKADGRYILATDTDLAVPIEEFGKLWEHRDNDIVLGSRRTEGSRVTDVTRTRRILGSANYVLIKRILNLGVNDTQCGFKLFNADKLKSILKKTEASGFLFDAELLLLAELSGFSIKEVGVRWISRPDSRIVIWRHPPEMLLELLNIFFKKKTGAYDGKSP